MPASMSAKTPADQGCKRHILVDTLGMPLNAEVHSAGIQDRDGAALIFNKLVNRFPFIEKIYGEGGYHGPKVKKASPGRWRSSSVIRSVFRYCKLHCEISCKHPSG
jgi:hypothetical protein